MARCHHDDSLRHPAYPKLTCPTLIIHGTDDEQVPIETSRSYALEHPNVKLVEVRDDHGLATSIDTISSLVEQFFELSP